MMGYLGVPSVFGIYPQPQSRGLCCAALFYEQVGIIEWRRRKAVLFIVHEASWTGASFVLLHCLRWLCRHFGLKFQALLRKGGPLVNDDREVVRTRVFDGEVRPKHGELAEKILCKVGLLP
jgi:hypothetical protein